MPAYYYEVKDAAGEVILGEADAPNRAELVRELESLQYVILGIREKPTAAARFRLILDRFGRVGVQELALFTRQFSLLMSAGVPLLKALNSLAQHGWSGRMLLAILGVAEGVRTGRTLSGSMERHPHAFAPVYVALIRAGEVSGGLEEIMRRLSDFLERDLKLHRRLQSSLTYPVFIFAISVLVTVFLVLFIFPAFIGFFEGLDLELPALSRFLLAATRLATDPWVVFSAMILIPFLAYQAFAYFATTDPGRRHWAWLVLRTPVVGTVHRNVVLARFCRTLGILLECGVPIMTALEVVGTVVGNGLVQEDLRGVGRRLRDGNTSLAEELLAARFIPDACGHMLTAAEQAGKVPRILGRLADHYDSEVELSLLEMLALLEPIMLAVMGAVVGFILLAVFMPIYSLLDAL
ncbi:MAG: type II secretion system F family protein [Candidatus Eremiobacterota bacterium]